MRQELQIWRSETGSRRWLSALIAAMEEAERPEPTRRAVSAETLAQFQAHLALPAAWPTSADSSLRH